MHMTRMLVVCAIDLHEGASVNALFAILIADVQRDCRATRCTQSYGVESTAKADERVLARPSVPSAGSAQSPTYDKPDQFVETLSQNDARSAAISTLQVRDLVLRKRAISTSL